MAGENNTDSRMKEKQPELAVPIAPDGGWGWVVVFSSFMIHVIADGLAYSFGLFYVEFLDDFDSTKGETSVVASLIVGVSFLIGPLASVLVNRYNCRLTAVVGAVVAALGYTISFWAPNVYFLYFSYGILTGSGFGLLIHPAIVVVGEYFDKKRSLTTGIAICGSGVGTLAFPPFIKLLVDAYAWQGASLILGGIILNLGICATAYRPLRFTGVNDALSHLQIPDMEEGKSSFFKDLKKEIKLTINLALLKDFPFLLFVLSGTLTSIGYNAPFIFLPHHAELNEIGESDASLLISIIGISNIFGRVLFGFAGDFFGKRRLYLFCTTTALVGTSTALLPYCKSYALMATYAAVFGFTVGGVIVLNWVLLPDLVGVENLASSLGLSMFFDGVTTPIGPPFLGWIFDMTGSYDTSFIIGGVMIAISGLILYPIPCIRAKSFPCVMQPSEKGETVEA